MSIWLAKIKSKVGGVLVSLKEPPVPEVTSGAGSVSKIADLCMSKGFKKVLVVTDELLSKLGLLDSTLASLRDKGVEYVLFDKVTPDPIISQCEEAKNLYLSEKCQAIIAFGGGSSMDCAKFTACWATDPEKDFKKFFGSVLGIGEDVMPCLIAVPTTAGTGSETTAACVVSYPEEKKKYASIDAILIPKYVFLDPNLLESLPKPVTAATGIDALTHAVESYISPWRSETSMKMSKSATVDVFKYLVECCKNPKNLDAREKMLNASFNAGAAFTRAGLGYVHAMAHQLGGLYHVPHGVANGMLLPIVLEYYLSTPTNAFVMDSYADLMLAIRGEEGKKVSAEEKLQLAREFVAAVRDLVRAVEIPAYAKGFPASMVDTVARRAIDEGHGNTYSFWEAPTKVLFDFGYPVPKYMTLEQCKDALSRVIDPTIVSAKL